MPRCRFLVVAQVVELRRYWFVYEVGTRNALSAFEVLEDAIRSARFLADSSAGELLIMNPDGSLAAREDHGARAKVASPEPRYAHAS